MNLCFQGNFRKPLVYNSFFHSDSEENCDSFESKVIPVIFHSSVSSLDYQFLLVKLFFFWRDHTQIELLALPFSTM